MNANEEQLDLLVIGAGLSGIDAAYHLQTNFPGRTYAILEARDAIGGTWDLFRYPGVRSDSDMHTLGFPFRPWHADESIAAGGDIRNYIRDTAAQFGIDRHIRFGHKVKYASWSSEDQRWTVDATVNADGSTLRLVCQFLYMCSGYYSYEQGYSPQFVGLENFKGTFVHPQQWPEGLEYAGKQVVVIGSGATAVTLVPALAADAHVTMLQRSPSYIASRPAKDAIAIWLYAKLPARLAAKVIKWKNVLYNITMFSLARKKPEQVKAMLRKDLKRHLDAGYDVDQHFTPRYNPWDQRICLVPDADLFAAIRAGRTEIVTDTIDTFTEIGIKLGSGKMLPADIVVSATGLVMQLMGGAELIVDGVAAKFNERLIYKGVMISGVPNLFFAFGYTNNSWTLRCDLSARYVCRVLKYMDKNRWTTCVPHPPDATIVPEPISDFSSGYFARATSVLPRQGQKMPWKVHQNYVKDAVAFALGSVSDGTLEFGRAPKAVAKSA